MKAGSAELALSRRAKPYQNAHFRLTPQLRRLSVPIPRCLGVVQPTRIASVDLTERFDLICGRLPRGWTQLPLKLVLANAADTPRAATVLGPLSPGRSSKGFAVRVFAPGQGAPGVAAVRRALAQLDGEHIQGRLLTEETADPQVRPIDAPRPARTMVDQWDTLAGALPPGWSDVLVEFELGSSGDIDRGALLLGPLNPLLQPGAKAFRFRAARSFGYGASIGMTRRSFERLDEQGIGGSIRLVRVMSDSQPVASQGPVWRIGGRSV